MKELISIIVPVYNGEKYLKNCIESIRKQTCENIEIILVNDGSTDNSLAMCMQAKEEDSRIKVIDKANGGVSSARNVGIDASSGTFIAFVDCDDTIKPDMIDNLYSAAVQYDADIVRGKTLIGRPDGSFESEDFHGFENTLIGKEHIREIIPHFIAGDDAISCYTPLLMIRKSVITRFHTELNYMEDAVYFVELLLRCNSLFLLDKAIYEYRYNVQSVSHRVNTCKKNMLSIASSEDVIKKMLSEAGWLDDDLERRINTKCINLMFAKAKLLKNSKYNEFKAALTEVFGREDVIGILNKQNSDEMSAVKKIQCFLARKRMFGLLVLVTKFTVLKG